MEKSSKKNSEQVIFFDKIKKVLPSNQVLVNEVSELLNIGYDAAYRRIRGAKLLDFDETLKLSRHYGISLDLVTNVTQKNQLICTYLPMDRNPENYLSFINSVLKISEKTSISNNSEIIMSCVDIPIFNFLEYEALTNFKIFSWAKSVYGFEGKYQEFISRLEPYNFGEIHKKIVTNYHNTPSSDIWTFNTTDTMIRLISYHHQMKHFEDERFPLFLCEQLLDFVNKIQEWTEKGAKGPNGVPYKFYVSEIDTGNTIILFKLDGNDTCLVRLFTFNGLNVSDERLCLEAENWLYNLTQRAILISGASEIERFKFFTGQRQKIEFLIEKLKADIEGLSYFNI